jgi:hypothetical protein
MPRFIGALVPGLAAAASVIAREDTGDVLLLDLDEPQPRLVPDLPPAGPVPAVPGVMGQN